MVIDLRSAFVSALLCFFVGVSTGQVRLPQLISDGMVLQRDRPIAIWGWAARHEKVKLQFAGESRSVTADTGGRWSVRFPARGAGGPFTLEINASNRLVVKDILLGDVWLCSGQSNMVHQMKLHSVRYANDVAGANYPGIRQFWVPNQTDLQGPKDDLPSGNWKSANPQDVLEFSAVAYFFAKDLYEKYHVPMGIINASVGGVPIEAFTSEEGLKDFPGIISTIKKNKDTAYTNGSGRRAPGTWNVPGPADRGLWGRRPGTALNIYRMGGSPSVFPDIGRIRDCGTSTAWFGTGGRSMFLRPCAAGRRRCSWEGS